MSVETTIDTIEKIKNAFEILENRLPINAEKFVEMFYELTNCEIEYNIFVNPRTIMELSERFVLRIYEVEDRLYCNKDKFIINVIVIDVYDNKKSVAWFLDYKPLSIRPNR